MAGRGRGPGVHHLILLSFESYMSNSRLLLDPVWALSSSSYGPCFWQHTSPGSHTGDEVAGRGCDQHVQDAVMRRGSCLQLGACCS